MPTRRMPACRALLISLLLALPGCARLLNATVPTSGLQITRNVAYGSLPRQKLDVYRLKDLQAPRPVVVFFYGGSWRTGSKNIYPFVAAALARRGLVVVVPDYRLYPEVRYPEFLDDSAKAVAFTEAHAAQWQGNPHQIVLMGHSAGAYNAAMLAVEPDYIRAAGGQSEGIAGLVGLAGPYDFLPITDPDIIPIFPHDDPASMPVNHVRPGVPPMLLLAGQDDTTVKPRNSYSLAEHARGMGGIATVKTYPDTAHIGLILDFTPPFRGRAPVLKDVVDWINRLLPPVSAAGGFRSTAK